METAPTTPTPARTPVGKVLGISLGLAVLVGVITLAFAWPSTDMGPGEVPIAVVGPPEAADQVAGQLDEAQPDGFDVISAADADAAIEMIEQREVYAALAIGPDGVNLYTASAASPGIARLVGGIADQIAAGMGEQAGQPGSVTVTTEDVAPLPANDPNGAGLGASAFPMAVGGIIIAALLGMNVRGSGRQIVGAVLAPLAVGATVAALLLYVLEAIEGDYLVVAGAVSLTLLAAAWAVLGLQKVFGRIGLILGAATIMLVGNPLSGMVTGPEMLPAPWGEFGQFLTPGAGATLLKSVAFFDNYGATTAVVVLASWLAGGIVLFTIGAVRAKVKAVGADASEPVGVAV
ncbi:hypothetical protein [Glycomyces buryatensis]|uniref:hypothetical protein n=1 Tax=Glycomyces buryatensis TaxID=2570927 RepID=UPI001B3C1799|nr:hypothetical protein [Glycomyces buryatensis]